MDSEGKGDPPPSPSELNKLFEPLATVDKRGGLTWTEAFWLEAEKAGIEKTTEQTSEEQAPTPRKPLEGIRFIAEQVEAESAPESNVQAIADTDRYAWFVTRRFAVRKVGQRVTLYHTVVPSRPTDLRLVTAGAYLPAIDNGDIVEPTLKACRLAGTDVGVYHDRKQLLVFEARSDVDQAEAYIEALASDL